MVLQSLIQFIINEITILFTALMFYSKIPGPKWVPFTKEHLDATSRYFPLVGIIVGSIGALVFVVADYIFPLPIAIILSMISTIAVTGYFHEDGFADICDGFGGGNTKEKILTIMKDSRVGAFGAIGIWLMLSIKYLSLSEINSIILPASIVAAHSISRFATSTLMFTHKYVRENDPTGKALANRISIPNLLIGGIIGISPLLLFNNFYYFLILIPVAIVTLILGQYFKSRIGGYTGDCLGATQQITEVTVYLCLLVNLNVLK